MTDTFILHLDEGLVSGIDGDNVPDIRVINTVVDKLFEDLEAGARVCAEKEFHSSINTRPLKVVEEVCIREWLCDLTEFICGDDDYNAYTCPIVLYVTHCKKRLCDFMAKSTLNSFRKLLDQYNGKCIEDDNELDCFMEYHRLTTENYIREINESNRKREEEKRVAKEKSTQDHRAKLTYTKPTNKMQNDIESHIKEIKAKILIDGKQRLCLEDYPVMINPILDEFEKTILTVSKYQYHLTVNIVMYMINEYTMRLNCMSDDCQLTRRFLLDTIRARDRLHIRLRLLCEKYDFAKKNPHIIAVQQVFEPIISSNVNVLDKMYSYIRERIAQFKVTSAYKNVLDTGRYGEISIIDQLIYECDKYAKTHLTLEDDLQKHHNIFIELCDASNFYVELY